MEEYQLSDTLPALIPTWDQVPATLTISLDCGDASLTLTSDPSTGSITLQSDMSDEDDLAFDVEDFALVTTLLIRQAQRG